MLKNLFLIIPLILLFSCNNDDDSNSKEIPVYYGFNISSVSNYPTKATEEERKVEITIDGITHIETAPFDWYYRKQTTLNETSIKVRVNSNRNTRVIYEVRKNLTYDKYGNFINPGKVVIIKNFDDKLDTILKLK